MMKLMIASVLLTAGLLAGCSSETAPENASVQKTPPALARQVAQLETTGVKMIQQGDRLMIIIPTDYYFEPQSTRINSDHEKGLLAIAQFTKNFADRYPNSVIKVTGYTDKMMSPADQTLFSQKYAEAIGSFLFNVGLPMQRLAISGRGSNEPIANETQPGSMSMNRRVVIRIN
jgi:outer membrane protein OmpA-like peptidoglycan-associated protein